MRITVPIHYALTGIKKGGGRTSTIRTWDYHDVDIPELKEELAPICVEWDAMPEDVLLLDARRFGSELEPKVNGTMHVRRECNNWWKPMTLHDFPQIPDWEKDTEILSYEQLSSHMVFGKFTHPFGNKEFTDQEYLKLNKCGFDPYNLFEIIKGSGRSHARLCVERIASQYRSAGGTIYERCPEPRIGVIHAWISHEGEEHPAHLLVVSTKPQLHTTKVTWYNIEDVGQAIEHVHQSNHSRPVSSFLKGVNDRLCPRFPIPEMFAEDKVWNLRMSRLANEIACVVGDRKTAQLDNAILLAFGSIRKALSMNESDERYDLMEEAASSVAIFQRHDSSLSEIDAMFSELASIAGCRRVEVPVITTAGMLFPR